MTQFVENLVDSVEDAAKLTAKGQRGRPKARKLLSVLRGKRRILVTCHRHPDPDALGSVVALRHLLQEKLADLAGEKGPDRPDVDVAVIGESAGGINDAFTKNAQLDLTAWDDARLTDPNHSRGYDAIVLCDVQPTFRNSPLPENVAPTVIIDHHRARGRKPTAEFVDIRTDVGATASIVFSYFMELDIEPSPALAATMVYAIESDLAGAAGQPSDLDNLALSTLTVRADTRRLYRMRHVELPQHYFVSYANALADAQMYERVMFAHLGPIEFLEKPAVIADFLLRYDGVDWVIVTATAGVADKDKPDRLVISGRAGKLDLSAGEIMRKAISGIGEGGGHRTKAGGVIRLDNGSPTEIDRVRLELRRRVLRALKIADDTRGKRLLDIECDADGRVGLPVRFTK